MKHRNHVPIRTCISCGSKRSKRHLLRLVRDDEGCIKKDEPACLPGRGAYVCRVGSCLDRIPKGRLERALPVKKA